MDKSKRQRIAALDLFRGVAMIYVMLYHLLYDMKFIYGVNIPDPIAPRMPVMEAVHLGFLWVLFLVSGMCTRYSRDPVKRGAALYIIGFAITLGTSYFMPSELIVFGVLSCFGACMVICGLIDPLLKKFPWQPTLIISLVLWFMFMDFYKGTEGGVLHLLFTDITVPLPQRGDYIYPLGIKSRAFYSSDYFPVIPYIFMFLCGYALHIPVKEKKLPEGFYRLSCKPIEFIGRHSLVFYALHQVVFMAVLELIF